MEVKLVQSPTKGWNYEILINGRASCGGHCDGDFIETAMEARKVVKELLAFKDSAQQCSVQDAQTCN